MPITFVGAESLATDIFDDPGLPNNDAPYTIDMPPAVEGTVFVAFLSGTLRMELGLTPTGWTHHGEVLWSSLAHNMLTYVCGPTPPATETFWFLTTCTVAGSVLAFNGVDPANPVNAHDASSDSGLTCDTLPITTDVDNCMLVAGVSGDGTESSWTPPAGMTEATDISAVTITNATAYQQLGPAGLVASRSFTANASTTSAFHVAALRPRSGWHVGYVGQRS